MPGEAYGNRCTRAMRGRAGGASHGLMAQIAAAHRRLAVAERTSLTSRTSGHGGGLGTMPPSQIRIRIAVRPVAVQIVRRRDSWVVRLQFV